MWYAHLGTHMNHHTTIDHAKDSNTLPVIAPSARITAFHAGGDVSTADLTQTEVLVHKADLDAFAYADLVAALGAAEVVIDDMRKTVIASCSIDGTAASVVDDDDRAYLDQLIAALTQIRRVRSRFAIKPLSPLAAVAPR